MATATKTRNGHAPATAPAAEFVYQKHPELGAARARLAQLRAELSNTGSQASELRARYEEMQSALLRAESDAALGQPADVAAARAAFQAARDALNAYQPSGGALRAEIKRVQELVEKLEREERELNAAPLRAAAREIVSAMLAHLRAAAELNARLAALYEAAGGQWSGSLAQQCLPMPWGELTPQKVYGGIGACKLDRWEREARDRGLVD